MFVNQIVSNRGGPVIEQDIGIWNNFDGLRMYEPNMWRRRSNLHGAPVRATCITFPILTPEFHYDSDGNIIGGRGFMIEMLELLQNDVNMTAPLSLTVDGKFGGKTKNGSYNGMVGMLMRNETDVVVATLTYTPVRHKVIDYTIPIFAKNSLTLWAPLGKGVQLNYTAFIDIFPVNVWILIAASFIILAIAFYIINTSGVNKFHEYSDSESFGLLNSIALSVILAIQLSYNVIVNSTSARIIYLVGSIMAYLLFSYYECDLTARMTTASAKDDIRNFQDVIDKEYKVLVKESSSNHEVLKNAEEGSAMHKVYWDSIHDYPEQFVGGHSDALNKIFSREKTLYFAPEISSVLGEVDRLKKLREVVFERQNPFMTCSSKRMNDYLMVLMT